MKRAAEFGLILLVALALTVLPGGGAALDVALTLLTMAFLSAIAYLVYRVWRERRMEIEGLGASERLVLYGALGLAVLTFTATNRLFDAGGPGVIVWLGLLALCSYGVFWVWTRYRRFG